MKNFLAIYMQNAFHIKKKKTKQRISCRLYQKLTFIDNIQKKTYKSKKAYKVEKVDSKCYSIHYTQKKLLNYIYI